jgi:hypothetical protein
MLTPSKIYAVKTRHPQIKISLQIYEKISVQLNLFQLDNILTLWRKYELVFNILMQIPDQYLTLACKIRSIKICIYLAFQVNKNRGKDTIWNKKAKKIPDKNKGD